MPSGKFVAYYRVSTAKQARSGLGLEAQQEAVRTYLNGGDWRLLGEFTDIESGKANDRPELLKAIQRAKLTGARLLIAKLDRLSRNAAFLMTLKDNGTDFVAVDMPDANRLTVGIMAVMAQHEREMISARAKAALAAAKTRGQKLGGWRGGPGPDGLKGRDATVAQADRFARALEPVLADIRTGGVSSLRGIAAELAKRDISTPRGGQWTASAVRNLLARVSKLSENAQKS